LGNEQPSVPPSVSELEEFFDLAHDLMVIVGFDGYFKRVNPAVVRTLGYSSRELLSRPFFEFLHPDDVQRSRDGFPDRVSGNAAIGYEVRYRCADGSVRWIQWNSRTVPEAGLAYGVGRDVTDRRRADAELRAAKRMVETSRAELGVLAEEQAALRRVATLVAHESPPAEVFAAVAEEVRRLLRVEDTTIFRYEDDWTATVVADRGERDVPLPIGSRLSLEGESATALVRRTGRAARVDDFSGATGPLADYTRNAGIGSTVGGPIVVDGRLWGAMIAATRTDEPMPADSESRIEQFTELVATAISNMQARSDLAASRARIVAATDEERRRVVRDLHDGAQQRLVHTTITLKLARRALQNGDEQASALVTEALDHAERATTELRELAHGILPTVLTAGGLRAGVEALRSRMPLPVKNGVSVGRLPAPVEATAYFVVSEALTNVAKHARAARAEVTARIEEGSLAIRVSDDGVGDARPEGSGLVGLADRLAALDGVLRVESPSGGGTLITAAIPLQPNPSRRGA
jgi:PAS domain S-box-containing protein